MTKTIDLLALLRVRMHHGTWDAPGNESAGAFPGIVKHTTPRKHAWVRGTPTPRKGLPRAQINVGAAPRTTKMRHKARGKKCSLGLQVTVEAEAGLFWQQRRNSCGRSPTGTSPRSWSRRIRGVLAEQRNRQRTASG